ncbi:MAG: hypothetical protein ACLFNO_02430 [Parcubacteria group bacterium]
MNIKTENSVLKRLFEKETIKIKATEGKTTIAEAENIFEGWIDPGFKIWNLDNPQIATNEIVVEVYEVVKNADFRTMFDSLNEDPNKLCLTQSQIVDFCKNHKDRLHSNWFTFFLFKENNQYFVACVGVFSDGLYVRVFRFELASVWFAEFAHRFVVPQLNLEA